MERQNPFRPFDPAPLPPEGDRALEICLVRGASVESRHRVHIVVVNGAGETVHRWGNPELTLFPRSAVKLIQASAWVSRGFALKGKVSTEGLALACASHEGEAEHVKEVAAWLARIHATEADLECGAHYPYSVRAAHALVRAGKMPSQLHNNCSGKHAGFLTFCRECDWETLNYSSYDHPVQAAIRQTFSEFFGLDAAKVPWGVDGCGIPTYALPLQNIAAGIGKLADPRALSAPLGEAVRTLNAALAAKPHYIGGTDSFCTKVIAESKGKVFAKMGAEGVYAAWIPQLGLGLAMKSEDGSPRAPEVALVAVLGKLGFPLQFFSPLVRRWNGEVVGQFICA
jgi:L-asparaginase II